LVIVAASSKLMKTRIMGSKKDIMMSRNGMAGIPVIRK
jgi:hypothetical protein